jgi:hypothetical protein
MSLLEEGESSREIERDSNSEDDFHGSKGEEALVGRRVSKIRVRKKGVLDLEGMI